MGNEKKTKEKQQIVLEITDKIKRSSSVIFFDYRGLKVSEVTELRSKLKAIGTDLKVYKNSLTKRALENLGFNIDESIFGPNAMSFSEDIVEPIKLISDYAKEHKKLEIKVGIIEGKISSTESIFELSTIPSREGLLTMLAGGMMGITKDLSICLHLLCEQKSE